MNTDAAVPDSKKPDAEYLERFKLAKLPKLSCSNNDCDNGLHCFRYYEGQRRKQPPGACNQCGTTLVNWKQVHRCDLSDVDPKVKAMKLEWIRHYYWHVNIDAHALRLARFRGRKATLEMLRARLQKGVLERRPADGRDVGWKGDIINYARHGTATCCRKCIAYWHGIPLGQTLSLNQLEYLSALGEHYIAERLPDLQDAADPSMRKRPRRKAKTGNVRERKWRP